MEILDIQENISLSELCTFGIGGKAKTVISVTTIAQMQAAIIYCLNLKIPYLILGKGSNCLFSDEGFEGAIIHNKIIFLQKLPHAQFRVGAGYSFSLLGTKTARLGFTGLEFACGIPATVGGAIFMNAGANGYETKDSLFSLEYIDESGHLKVCFCQEIEFSYRFSSFQKRPGVALVAATFQLKPCSEARAKQLKILNYRAKTQPYGDKSAGCVFKNTPQGPAGALIEASGLKRAHVGGAEVSALHANFIVNCKQATAQDVKNLIAHIQRVVKDKQGINLESEIRLIGTTGELKSL